MKEKWEQILTSGVRRSFCDGLTCILVGLALVFCAIKDVWDSMGQSLNSSGTLLTCVGIIFLLVGAGVLLFLFLPGYRREQEERTKGTHSYIGSVIYDASEPGAAPKTGIEAVPSEHMLNIGASGEDETFLRTLSTEEKVALDAVLNTTKPNPYGSILQPENPKPVNYGRTTDEEQGTVETILNPKDPKPYGSVLHPKNPKPVNYGRTTDKGAGVSKDAEERISGQSEDRSFPASVMDESLKQTLSPKEMAALESMLSLNDSQPYESVLHPENPKPVNYGRTTDGGDE